MLYFNETHIAQIGIPWYSIIDKIIEAIQCLNKGDYAQPVKPYLRYRDLKNRIIAMPAFVGGSIDMVGIKWIASFPDNVQYGIPRAHSIIILNDPVNGIPLAIINTSLISIIRTASVSGLMIRKFDDARALRNVSVGIIGFGPIGRYHLTMCHALLGERIERIFLYDLQEISKYSLDFPQKEKIIIARNWIEAYTNSDIFITCTVSKAPYIDKPPKAGSLQLNVSLRDYKVDCYEYMKNAIIVDNWEEICRENTDIEMMHKHKGLEKHMTKSIEDVVVDDCLTRYEEDQAIMFNPMGMAIFDIAASQFYYHEAKKNNIGYVLP